MLSGIWTDILVEWDRKLRIQHRKVILFVDNAACHKLVGATLTNITITFMPPNTTSLIQPLDQGIIRASKVYYRHQIVRKQLAAVESGISIADFGKSISILNAMNMLKSAWFLVKSTTIQNCFRKAGFPQSDGDVGIENETEDSTVHESITDTEFNELVNCDNDLECYGDFTDEEICTMIRQEESQEEGESSVEQSAEIAENEPLTVPPS